MNTRLVVQEEPFVQRLAEMHEQVLTHTRRRASNVGALAVGDALAIGIVLAIAGLVRYVLVASPEDAIVLPWMWGLVPLYVGGAAILGLYPGWGMGVVEELRRTTLLLVGLFGVTAVVLFLVKQGGEVSRLVLSVAFVLAIVAMPLARNLAKRLLVRRGTWGVSTVIYGAGATGRRVVDLLRQERGLGYVPAALFDDDPNRWGEEVHGVPVLGGTRLVTSEAQVAVLAMPTVGRDRTVELLEGPLACYRTVIVVPDLADAPSLWVSPRDLGGLLSLEITATLTSPWARLVKRSFDVAAVTLTAPLWATVCALIAVVIWLEDRQSPLFRQTRIGRDGRLFDALKFRTMVTDAEAVLERHLAEDADARAEWEAHFKLTRDPRVTRVGRLLRRFSLDELPQLINVARGEMSLVGPRPLPRYHHGELPLRVRELRERVRPGITGLWQVSGRSDIGTAGMERWDPYYVRNWSPWLDVVVLARTVRAVVKASGAY